MKTQQAQAKPTEPDLDEQQIVDYLISHPEFFKQHSFLLADMEIPHESGKAVSLIERQIQILRDRNKHFEEKLYEMVDAVYDNQRLNNSLQHIAISLFFADGIDDVIATVVDELRNKLDTEFAVIRLITNDQELAQQLPERYSFIGDEKLELFHKLIEEKNIQCGRLTEQQINYLFAGVADQIGSGAILPLADTDTFAILGLASKDEQRYNPGMGTEFLQQLADLVSAALKPYLD